ncbi:trypsin-like serine peptidase [Caulobacter hibisci]|uniref:Serine protease n=1 Tax=Caulobacter hibisci TaxID=2035993 RepID=A0ABS0T1V6_9CAUL|nr:serine protease [Caulobacter hibisci]MBI1685855.1 trypsin-like peptidase domain-containing protein [Caulobacter hibisci]
MTDEVEAAARARIAKAASGIRRALRLAEAGNPYAAEPETERLRDRLQRKAALTPKEAVAVAANIQGAAQGAPSPRTGEAMLALDGKPSEPPAPPPLGAEAVWGDSLDFVNVSFLAKGAKAARAVGRVAFRNGRPRGSGFLIGGGLFITNNHVIDNPEIAQQLVLELDYEVDLRGQPRPVSRYAFDTAVFITDPVSGLDFTVIGVGAAIDANAAALDGYGFCGLSDAKDKHMLGEYANIVQHPEGRHKEVVLRENRLVSRYDDALHYVADTQPGSSGAPVFNSEWDVIALHHWGGPWIQKTDAAGAPLANIQINEGVRISAIVRTIRQRLAALEPLARDRLSGALDLGAAEYFADDAPPSPVTPPPVATGAARVDPDGRVTWTIPLELSVHIPLLAQGAALGPAASPAVAAGTPAEAIVQADAPEAPTASKPKKPKG